MSKGAGKWCSGWKGKISYFKGNEKKKFKKYSISCLNNTKFLHTIADVFLYLMHKKWNTYIYLESDTTI